MSPNTPKGYPYPVGTDPMSDGDNVLNQLATSIDTRLGALASGSFIFTKFANTNPDNTVVTFPVGRFISGPPIFVQATANTTAPASARVGAQSTNPTSFQLGAWRESGTGNLTVYWVAIQQA